MQFKIYCVQTKKEETVLLMPTQTGWYVEHELYQGPCNPDGTPYLTKNHSSYPPALMDAFEELWTAYQKGDLQQDDLQEHLNRFSIWLKAYRKEPAFKLSRLQD